MSSPREVTFARGYHSFEDCYLEIEHEQLNARAVRFRGSIHPKASGLRLTSCVCNWPVNKASCRLLPHHLGADLGGAGLLAPHQVHRVPTLLSLNTNRAALQLETHPDGRALEHSLVLWDLLLAEGVDELLAQVLACKTRAQEQALPPHYTLLLGDSIRVEQIHVSSFRESHPEIRAFAIDGRGAALDSITRRLGSLRPICRTLQLGVELHVEGQATVEQCSAAGAVSIEDAARQLGLAYAKQGVTRLTLHATQRDPRRHHLLRLGQVLDGLRAGLGREVAIDGCGYSLPLALELFDAHAWPQLSGSEALRGLRSLTAPRSHRYLRSTSQALWERAWRNATVEQPGDLVADRGLTAVTGILATA